MPSTTDPTRNDTAPPSDPKAAVREPLCPCRGVNRPDPCSSASTPRAETRVRGACPAGPAQPTPKQLAYPKGLAEKTATTFAYPHTSAQASAETKRPLAGGDPPPVDVVAERLQPWRRVSATTLIGGLDERDHDDGRSTDRRRGTELASDDTDALRQVAPAVYVQARTGLTAGRDGKVSCPFHGEDRTPSLHVYSDPAEGWYCYGC